MYLEQIIQRKKRKIKNMGMLTLPALLYHNLNSACMGRKYLT